MNVIASIFGAVATCAEFCLDLLGRNLRGRPSISIGKWAESVKVKIPPDESHGVPGDYSEDTEPIATIIHEFLLHPKYKVFIGPKPSRIGFTLAAMIGIAYWIAHHSHNIIFCIDDQKKVKRLSRTRLVPLLTSISALADIMPPKKKLTALALYLRGITLFLGGAKSISDVTSDTAGLVIGDEVDQWRDFASGEASAFHHLLDRIMDVPGAKGIFFGKPRNEDDILWTETMTGTRHKCFVPCPHCDFMQPLEFKQLKFNHCRLDIGNYDLDRVRKETYYECANPRCKIDHPEHQGRIYERHKATMLKRREWRQTYFGDDPDYQLDPEKMSVIGVNQLYCLRPKLTFGEVAAAFCIAQKKGGVALAHYFRTRFGEPERQSQAVVKKDELRKLSKFASNEILRKFWGTGTPDTSKPIPRKPYKHGQCPWKPLEVVMFADMQMHEIKWVKMAFRGRGEGVVIDYGIFVSLNELIAEANKPIEILDWGDTPEDERTPVIVGNVWIDEGGNDNNNITVREFCARRDTFGRFFPSKGAGGVQISNIVQPSKREVPVDWHPSGKVEFYAYHFSHNTFATELYHKRIIGHEAALLAVAQGLIPEAELLWFPANPDDQFLNELCTETLQRVRRRGRSVLDWVKRSVGKMNTRANDFGDGVKGCLAMWYALKPAHLSEVEEEEKKAGRGRDYVLHGTSRVDTTSEELAMQS